VSVVVVLTVLGLAAGAVVLGSTLEGGLAFAWAGVLVVSALGVLGFDERRRLRRLADQVSGWIGARGYRPIETRRDEGWQRLVVALNALGAAYERRGAKLARERPWRRELVDALVNPALLFSNRSRLLAANDAARNLLGIPIDVGEVTVVQAVGSGPLAGAVTEVEATGRPVTVDAEHLHHDLRAVASRVGDETLLIVTDRTRERQVEELRRNFVVNASHELKTPVTSIKTLSEALDVTLDKGDEQRARALVVRLEYETERLARLVSDLLDLRRLEERGPLERVPVDLAELARQVVAGLLDRAEEREIELSVDAPDRAWVAGVPGDLEVIVKNLVANALQYNLAGGQVEVTIAPGDGVQVLIVRDTGIGIPQQDLARVFERFYRVDTDRSRESGGTGLGLSIVRHAVERHGGTIRVDSLLGEGTTFTVTLPIEPPRS
jgi:two-component system, OmpR family, sensor histidine kinase SenX3